LDDEKCLPIGRLCDAVRIEPGLLHPVAGQRQRLDLVGIGSAPDWSMGSL
jgi:hypothetical protein